MEEEDGHASQTDITLCVGIVWLFVAYTLQ